MPYLLFCKAVAVITLISLLVPPRALIILPLLQSGGAGIAFALLLLSVLALAIIAIAGLWRCRWWGFLAFYGYGFATTLLLGNALIPFVIALAPADARVAGVIALNAVALVAVAFLQWRYSKSA